MARTVVYSVLLYLSFFCNVLDAHDTEYDDIENTTKVIYKAPDPPGPFHFVETFDDEEKFKATWVLSEAKKEDIDEDIAKYDGIWAIEEAKRYPQEGDLGLVLKSKARHAAISAPLKTPFYFKDKPLVVQYEVNFQEGQECGGAYLKLLTLDEENKDLKNFHDKTPYTIMFGPDKCGNDHKLHFIFRHKNPLNGSLEEKHAKKAKDKLEEIFKDKEAHLYTLIVRPDNNYQMKVDHKIVNAGSLLRDFTPPVNPPLEVEDPDDKMPEDWDDREKIPDPLAVKPEDWDEDAPAQIVDEEDVMPEGWLVDEPPMIPNPDSVKPDDWDVEMDGEWEPPEIPNPKCADAPGCGPYKQKMKKNPRYKGKWLPPLITNPNYKGKWKPRMIPNPNYFNDEHPFLMSPIYAVGFELWSMSPDILFDNILITDNEQVAKKWGLLTFETRRVKIAEESETLWGRMLRAMNYKPGWWALYFCYCAIPITIYIWYLYKRSREWTPWRPFAKFTADHPWVWAVYVLAVGIPILLLIYCCCFAEQDKDDELDEDKHMEANNDATEEFNRIMQGDFSMSEGVSETEEVIGNEKEEESSINDGPRRRKLNKEDMLLPDP